MARACYTRNFAAGWSSSVARRAHNPEVAGSNPVPATISLPAIAGRDFFVDNFFGIEDKSLVFLYAIASVFITTSLDRLYPTG